MKLGLLLFFVFSLILQLEARLHPRFRHVDAVNKRRNQFTNREYTGSKRVKRGQEPLPTRNSPTTGKPEVQVDSMQNTQFSVSGSEEIVADEKISYEMSPAEMQISMGQPQEIVTSRKIIQYVSPDNMQFSMGPPGGNETNTQVFTYQMNPGTVVRRTIKVVTEKPVIHRYKVTYNQGGGFNPADLKKMLQNAYGGQGLTIQQSGIPSTIGVGNPSGM
nr:unnamed protein product [Haemonchus contortus]